jgi:hypothetical protein
MGKGRLGGNPGASSLTIIEAVPVASGATASPMPIKTNNPKIKHEPI